MTSTSRLPALALALAAALALPLAPQAAQAQAAAPAPASSPAKKALVAKVLAIQQPGIEALARQLAEQPAAMMLQQAAVALQRLPAERREAVGRELQADARKYAEEATPIVRKRALEIAPTTVGALLEERFTEDELKQLVAILESPVNKKFLSLGVEMQKAIGDKLVADTRAAIQPKVTALEQQFVARLQAQAAGAPTGGAAPAAPAAPQQPR